MPVLVSIAASRVDVVPGGTGSVEVTVRNVGTVVDEFRVAVLGPAAAWATASPDVVPLFPGASAPVVVTFAPPRSSEVEAGEVDVVVKVTSREDPDGSAAEELVVNVGGYDQPVAELVPRSVRAGRKARVQVAIDNLGNRRTQRAVSASDADRALKFEADPGTAVVEPGNAAFARLTIRPVKTFLRGPDRTVPYRATLVDGDSAVAVDGTFVQSALLPKWLLRALMFALAALLLLLLLWQIAFKPVIKSAARVAAIKQVEVAKEDSVKPLVDAINKLVNKPAAGTASPATPTPSGGTTPAAPTSPASATPVGLSAAGTSGGGGDDGKGGLSKEHRFDLTGQPGTPATMPWMPGPGRFSLTDIVLQNPTGAVGTITVQRDSGEVLVSSALENFRDLDFHVIAPYIVDDGKGLVVEVACAKDATAPCSASATLGGFLAPSPPTVPAPDASTTTTTTAP
jgi:hypothetical protein